MEYKLKYFNMLGRAHFPRLCFAYGNISFEDCRVSFPDFGAIKDSLPLGQFPVLEIGEETFFQSVAIARFASKLSGLYPTDAVLALKCDMYVDTIVELFDALNMYLVGPTEFKEQAKDILLTKAIPKCFNGLEKQLEGKTTYLVNDAPTMADIFVFTTVQVLKTVLESFNISGYPKLLGLYEEVEKIPTVKAFTESYAKLDQTAPNAN